jgi:outer membrane protein
VCVLALPAALAAQERLVTLEEAIRLAREKDPAVVQATGAVRSANANVLQARGSFLPSLSANASRGTSFSEGPSRVDPVTGEIVSGDITSGTVNFGLSSSIELFTGFRRGGQIRDARAGLRQQEASLQHQLAQSALRVSTIFFEALSATELIRAREASVAREEQKLRIAEARLATRGTTISDSLQAVVSLAEARLALLSQRTRLATAEANLARAVGLDGRVGVRADTSLFALAPAPDADALIAEALERSPAVRRTEAAVQAAQARLTTARAAYFPTLSLSGSTAWSGSDRTDFALFGSRSLSLGVSWSLFNRFGRETQITQQRMALESALAEAEDARRQVMAQLVAQLANLGAARERIAVTELSVEAARANVNVQIERYRLGTITITELGLAQDALNRAEEQGVSARFEYLRAKAEIEAIIGRPL